MRNERLLVRQQHTQPIFPKYSRIDDGLRININETIVSQRVYRLKILIATLVSYRIVSLNQDPSYICLMYLYAAAKNPLFRQTECGLNLSLTFLGKMEFLGQMKRVCQCFGI